MLRCGLCFEVKGADADEGKGERNELHPHFKIAASLANVGDPRGNTQLTLEEQASIGVLLKCP